MTKQRSSNERGSGIYIPEYEREEIYDRIFAGQPVRRALTQVSYQRYERAVTASRRWRVAALVLGVLLVLALAALAGLAWTIAGFVR